MNALAPHFKQRLLELVNSLQRKQFHLCYIGHSQVWLSAPQPSHQTQHHVPEGTTTHHTTTTIIPKRTIHITLTISPSTNLHPSDPWPSSLQQENLTDESKPTFPNDSYRLSVLEVPVANEASKVTGLFAYIISKVGATSLLNDHNIFPLKQQIDVAVSGRNWESNRRYWLNNGRVVYATS